MRELLVFVSMFLIVALGACNAERVAEVNDLLPIETPTPETDYLKVPQIAKKPLTKNQIKELDSTLPPNVRAILEKAETLEVLGLSSEDQYGISWFPDLKVSLPIGNERTELLDSFFFDASAGPNPSACFIPRHGFKATYKGKTVEVIICYQCHLFVVKGDLGKFNGGVYKDGSAAHHLFENLLRTRGQLIK